MGQSEKKGQAVVAAKAPGGSSSKKQPAPSSSPAEKVKKSAGKPARKDKKKDVIVAVDAPIINKKKSKSSKAAVAAAVVVAVAAKKKSRAEGANLTVPKEIRRRLLRRSGNVRVSEGALGPMDKAREEIIDATMLLCLRMAIRAGRSTIQTKDAKRALDILGIQIY